MQSSNFQMTPSSSNVVQNELTHQNARQSPNSQTTPLTNPPANFQSPPTLTNHTNQQLFISQQFQQKRQTSPILQNQPDYVQPPASQTQQPYNLNQQASYQQTPSPTMNRNYQHHMLQNQTISQMGNDEERLGANQGGSGAKLYSQTPQVQQQPNYDHQPWNISGHGIQQVSTQAPPYSQQASPFSQQIPLSEQSMYYHKNGPIQNQSFPSSSAQYQFQWPGFVVAPQQLLNNSQSMQGVYNQQQSPVNVQQHTTQNVQPQAQSVSLQSANQTFPNSQQMQQSFATSTPQILSQVVVTPQTNVQASQNQPYLPQYVHQEHQRHQQSQQTRIQNANLYRGGNQGYQNSSTPSPQIQSGDLMNIINYYQSLLAKKNEAQSNQVDPNQHTPSPPRHTDNQFNQQLLKSLQQVQNLRNYQQIPVQSNIMSAPGEKDMDSEASLHLPHNSSRTSFNLANQMPSSSGPNQLTNIKFSVKCDTQFKECVAIAGSIPQLGSWNVSKALKMSTNSSLYPTWFTEINVLKDSKIEYKFVKFISDQTHGSHERVEWESVSQNRLIQTGDMASIHVQEHFSNAAFRKEDLYKFPQIHNNNSTASEHNLNQSFISAGAHSGTLKQANQNTIQQQPASATLTTIYQKNQARQNSRSISQNSQKQSQFATNLQKLSLMQLQPQKENSQQIKENKSKQLGKRLKNQLKQAFPKEMELHEQEQIKRMQLRGKQDTVATTSNLSGTIDDTKPNPCETVLQFTRNRSKSLLFDIQEQDVNVKSPCVIQVALSLPYRLVSTQEGQFHTAYNYGPPSFLYANLDQLAQNGTYNFVWVGIVVTDESMGLEERRKAEEALKKKRCYGVFLTEAEITPYMRFLEGALRPSMHNFIECDDQKRSMNSDWSSFVEINELVANKVQQIRGQVGADVVWIHDLQYLLIPQQLRRANLKNPPKIGFYFHSSFPASAVFMTFPRRNEILKSLLNADVIGFHIWEYARNFVNTASRLLGLTYELSLGNTIQVSFDKRSVQIRIQHIGLDEDFLEEVMRRNNYELQRQVLNRILNKGQLVIGANNPQNQHRASLRTQNQYRSTQNLSTLSSVETGASTTLSNVSTDGGEFNGQQSQQRIVMSSIDTCHHLTAIVYKLRSYYKFLKQLDPRMRERIVLIQIIRGLLNKSDNIIKPSSQSQSTAQKNGNIAPNRQQTTQNQEEEKQGQNKKKQKDLWLINEVEALSHLNSDITDQVKKIWKEFGQNVLKIDSKGCSIEGRLALWSKTNILFVSTLKDGLYLTTFEFLWVKKMTRGFRTSAMLLSEYTGCSSQFAGHYEFNPFEESDMIRAIQQCINDSPEQKEARMKRAFAFCQLRTFEDWTYKFLRELIKSNPKELQTQNIKFNPQKVVSQTYLRDAIPIQFQLRSHAQEAVSTMRNLIIVDHEALPCKLFGRHEMFPQDEVIYALRAIVQDRRNVVVLISDKDKKYVQRVFFERENGDELLKKDNFWFYAESGHQVISSKDRSWQPIFQVKDRAWIQTIKEIMLDFCLNIDGSIVEERDCSILWNYQNAEEEHGQKASNQLVYHLKQLLGRNSPIEVVQRDGFVEVMPANLTKKMLLKNIFSLLGDHWKSNLVEALFYVGADISEDEMPKYLQQKLEEDSKGATDSHLPHPASPSEPPVFAQHCKSLICILGKRPSTAKYYIETRQEVNSILQRMGIQTTTRPKSQSSADLLQASNYSRNFQNSTINNQDQSNNLMSYHGGVIGHTFEEDNGIEECAQSEEEGSLYNGKEESKMAPSAKKSTQKLQVSVKNLDQIVGQLAEQSPKCPPKKSDSGELLVGPNHQPNLIIPVENHEIQIKQRTVSHDTTDETLKNFLRQEDALDKTELGCPLNDEENDSESLKAQQINENP